MTTELQMRLHRRVALSTKRVADVVAGMVLLTLLSPLIATIAAVILVTTGRPILFRQPRPGHQGEIFVLHKFRTMRPLADGDDTWRSDEARMGRVGRLLRNTSLDELPELTHVVSGKMSLVGPRPLLVEYLPKYSETQARRHDMRPGVTGLAQVSGRRNLTLGQRLDLDVQYVDDWSLWLDCRILARTLLTPFEKGDVDGQTLDDIDDVGFHTPSDGRE